MRLIIRSDAEADITSGRDWYEQQRDGLGTEFLEEISSTIAAVQLEPLRFPVVYRKLRRALVHRFPYGVFFIAGTDAIVVVAAIHLARDPRRVRGRTQSGFE